MIRMNETLPNAAPDLTEKFGNWISFLKYEKHYSRHTLRAYTQDLLTFFDFMTNEDKANAKNFLSFGEKEILKISQKL